MLELQILSGAMQDRKVYDAIDAHLEPKDLSPESQKVLKHIGDYYERDEAATGTDRELIERAILDSIPDHNEKHRDLFREFLGRIPKESSPGNVLEYVIGIKRDRIRHEIHQACLAKVDTKHFEGLINKWAEVGSFALSSDTIDREIYSGWSVEDLVRTHHAPEGLIKLLPVSLNKRLDGGLKPGHHVLVMAPTEMGKSLFCINLAYGFLLQKLRVLYIGNEDPIADLQMRLVNRITSKTRNEIRQAPTGYEDVLAKANYENFTIAGLSPGTFDEIMELTAEIDPHVVILDQLGNLDIKEADGSQTLQLLHASRKARTLGKKEARVVVSVGQAADDAYGRKNLRKNDLQWSNVDAPGQFDLIIGIGATEEMEQMGTRCLSFPKQKISGDHRPIDVRFVTEYSKVEDLANG